MASINNRPARILIDGGAEGNVISSKFCHSHNIPIINSGEDIPVQLPNGSSSLAHGRASFSFQRHDYSDNLSAIVYGLHKYDIILGKPWLAYINPTVNYRTNTVVFHHQGLLNRWDCTGFTSTSTYAPCYTSKSRLISAINLFGLASNDYDHHVLAAYVRQLTPSPDPAITPPDTPDPPPSPSPLPAAVRHLIEVVFPDVFPDDLPDGLPPDRGTDIRIDTIPNANPPVRPVIRLSLAELDELQKQLQTLQKKGFISPSTSAYGAPVLFVKKKDGSLRLCVDYRGLNKITSKNRHPLPRIDELIDRFKTAKYFSKLDLRSGYYQMQIHPDDRHKTAFRTRYGHYEFNVVPFGLTNAPAWFSTLMRTALAPLIDRCVVLYLDDILIYSDTEEQHIKDLEKTLALLREHQLYAKLSKCSFMQEETEFLGHVLSRHGISTNAGLVKAIREWPQPQSLKDVQQFLGLTNFYRQYVNNFASIALPLYDLTTTSSAFAWNSSQQSAFDALKKAVTSAPVLRIFNSAFRTAVETDASGFAVGAVLFQTDHNGVSRPVAFTSRKLNSAERNYPVHEQELLAVVHALRTWRYYLDGSHFIVYTDHATLKHFPTQPNLTRRQARWMELLQEYNFDFRYKPGKDNIVPDALSRRPDLKDPDPPPTINSIFTCLSNLQIDLDPDLFRKIKQGYEQDPKMATLIAQNIDNDTSARYYVLDDLLWFNSADGPRLCIPSDQDLRNQLFHEVHDSVLSGHLGFDKSYDEIRRYFYWPRLARDVKLYIKSCDPCQRNKPVLKPPMGLFQPLAIPPQRWHTVSMDFIVKLPKTSRGFDAITVFVDKLSKQVHFCPSRTTDSATDVARLYFQEVFRHHGMPRIIVSDRDSRFTAKFWTQLHLLLDTKLRFSTAFHPQSDGQTERANRTLEEMLRAYISYNQTNWDLLLPMMEFAYNSAKHASTGFSPFYLNNGFHPLVPAALFQRTPTTVPAVDDFVAQQSSALAQAQDQIRDAQDQQKEQADKSRRPSTLQVGDQVLLSAENISLAAYKNRPARKLEPKYIGPYTILEKIHENAFKLDLPLNMRQHPVFNTDLLRPYIASPGEFGTRTHPRPPPELHEDDQEWEVERIEDYGLVRRSPRWLVKWKGYPDSESTWEPRSSFNNAKEILEEFEQQRQRNLRTKT